MARLSMMRTLIVSGTLLAVPAATALSQIDQTIYSNYCVVHPDTTCFEPSEGAIDSVGRDVEALGGSFRFCFQFDTIAGYAPVRVVLVLDRSRSMCLNPGDLGSVCCTAGDGTGNCMMNDPNDMRIQAAHLFVDSLAVNSPESYVGVVGYDQSATINNPVILNSANNIADIHRWIDAASCVSQGLGPVTNPTPGGLGKTTGTKATGLGMGMEAGLKAVDNRFDEIPAGMTRHIIQLTDGAWDDSTGYVRGPDTLIARYMEQFPGREVPRIHGVFLSNADLHTAHNYPAEGCSDIDPVILDKLKRATDLTGGLYFPASTPATIIDNFFVTLFTIARTTSPQLVSLTVTNTTNGETSINGPIRQIGNSPVWETTLYNLPLEFGPNVLAVQRVIRKPGGIDSTLTTTVTIIRSLLFRETLDADFYKWYCAQIQSAITITVAPESQMQGRPFNVNAVITNASQFHLDTVQTRLLTRFPDNESGVLATFHLDGDLINASGGTAGVGSPGFTTTDMLFGSGAITTGSFTCSLPQLSDAFAIEAWVKPLVNNAAILFSGNGMEIGVNAGMKLYFKNDIGIFDSAVVPLDDGVWSHIGIARADGSVMLFINGEAVTVPANFAAPTAAGAMTVGAPPKWVIDEVRFSNTGRITNDERTRFLAIPTAAATLWNVQENASTGFMVTIPPSAWTNGASLGFTFAIPAAERVLVNIRQRESDGLGTGWSKNSNPVNCGTLSAEGKIHLPGTGPKSNLPKAAATYFNLLGKKVDNARHGSASRNRLPNGIYVDGTGDKHQQRNVKVK